MAVQILRRYGIKKFAQASTAASPGATTATKPTDESANEHVDGQRRSHFMTKFDKGSKSSVRSWRIEVRAQQVRSAAATMAARLAAV